MVRLTLVTGKVDNDEAFLKEWMVELSGYANETDLIAMTEELHRFANRLIPYVHSTLCPSSVQKAPGPAQPGRILELSCVKLLLLILLHFFVLSFLWFIVLNLFLGLLICSNWIKTHGVK